VRVEPQVEPERPARRRLKVRFGIQLPTLSIRSRPPK
jgi:hypothetical protein